MGSQPQIVDLLVEKYGIDAHRISADATLADLGLDSLSTAELVFDIEDLFKIEVRAEDAEFRTLGEAITLVDRYVAAKGA